MRMIVQKKCMLLALGTRQFGSRHLFQQRGQLAAGVRDLREVHHGLHLPRAPAATHRLLAQLQSHHLRAITRLL